MPSPLRMLLVGTMIAVILIMSVRGDDELVESSSSCSEENAGSPYVIIIDGGSTGSRLHIFEFLIANSDDDDQQAQSHTVERRGSARVDRPLSAFAPTTQHDEDETAAVVDAEAVAAHLLPLFQFAARQIPAACHATTPVHYGATAGMRLLDADTQENVYRAAYEGLVAHPDFRFTLLRPHHIATLSGELEGYYGAVAANYLHRTCSASLEPLVLQRQPVEEQHEEERNQDAVLGIVGALDMGGSSTQIVFHTGREDPPVCVPVERSEDGDDDQEQTCAWTDREVSLDSSEFFSTSYLSYGVDQFRERLWNLLVWDHTQHLLQEEDDDSCDAGYIENPCTNPGYTVEWEGYTLLGTGDAAACQRQVQRLIPHPESVVDHDNKNDTSASSDEDRRRRVVGGIEHPPVTGRFVAMSLYFFTLDCLRELTGHEELNASWPTPSIAELEAALSDLCERDWHDDLVHQNGKHRFTRPEVLPLRCFESVYMVTLLKDGFGFAPESRDITFAYEVNESEVEWTLGMALSLRAAARKAEDGVAPVADAAALAVDQSTLFEEETAAAASSPSLSGKKNATMAQSVHHGRRSHWRQLMADVLVSDVEFFAAGPRSYATLR